MSIFARFLQGLKAIPEGNGTLLDSTVAVLSSEVCDPNPHNYVDVPVIVAGRGGGFVNPGRHVTAGTAAQRADTGQLMLSILQGLKVPTTSFGQLKVTTPLAELAG